MADPGHEYSDERIGAIAEQVRAIYAEASESAEKGLAEWLESFAEKDADMRSKVEAGEMTERQWRDWRRHQMIQGRRWRELKKQLADGFSTANEQAAQIINGELPAIAAENANWGAFSVEKAAGVGTSFALQDAGTVHALLSEAAGLSVATVAVNAAADIAWNRKGIQSQMTQGIMLGESIPKMARRMERVGATNRAQAVRWARTYATAAENAGRVASYKRAQAMGIGLRQEWLATLDTRTRHSHRQLDGERREVGAKFSNGCRYPGDPQAPYVEVCNCRCTLVAAVDGIDQSDADRWSRLPDGMTYEEWKDEKRAEAAVEIDELTPCLRRLSDGHIVKTTFEKARLDDIDLSKWEFDWKTEALNGYTVMSLKAEGDERVQGLLAFKDTPENQSVFVDLVESAPHNSAHNNNVYGKEYNGVGAHLFAEAVKKSYELGYNGFIDFFAKTNLVEYYRKELGAKLVAGNQHMVIDEEAARGLYERYYGDKS